MRDRNSWKNVFLSSLAAGCCGLVACSAGFADEAKQEVQRKQEAAQAIDTARVDGAEIFAREWIPGDPRSHGGDGLGPMFNESSCVACHNQGGVGGAGPASKNVDIVTAFQSPQPTQRRGSGAISAPPASLPEAIFRGVFGALDPPTSAPSIALVPVQEGSPSVNHTPAEEPAQSRDALVKLHPGFGAAQSVVVHRSATYANYENWRMQMLGMFMGGSTPETGKVEFFAASAPAAQQGTSQPNRRTADLHLLQNQVQMGSVNRRNRTSQHGNFATVTSQRNTPALFGAGKIDQISEATLQQMAADQAKAGQVSGRVARLKPAGIGRFGWKGQTASLRDFVLTACAVELGLNVPDHPQAGVPHQPEYQPVKLDLNQNECDALIDYVASLPAPQQRPLAGQVDAEYVAAGAQHFAAVGCANCHVRDLGEATGLYSDLLLHDMGPELGDTGSYGVFVPNSTPDGQVEPLPDLAGHGLPSQQAQQEVIGATRQEWRTPPLWGVRDSAPYLHDGRAATLEQAIAMHGGEAEATRQKYFALAADERFQVVTFLKSLVTPAMVAGN